MNNISIYTSKEKIYRGYQSLRFRAWGHFWKKYFPGCVALNSQKPQCLTLDFKTSLRDLEWKVQQNSGWGEMSYSMELETRYEQSVVTKRREDWQFPLLITSPETETIAIFLGNSTELLLTTEGHYLFPKYGEVFCQCSWELSSGNLFTSHLCVGKHFTVSVLNHDALGRKSSLTHSHLNYELHIRISSPPVFFLPLQSCTPKGNKTSLIVCTTVMLNQYSKTYGKAKRSKFVP